MQSAWSNVLRRPIAGPRITHRDSLENKVLDFFDRNPGEELTVPDAVVKFDSEYMHMSKLFRAMFNRGLLRRHRDSQWSAWLYSIPGSR